MKPVGHPKYFLLLLLTLGLSWSPALHGGSDETAEPKQEAPPAAPAAPAAPADKPAAEEQSDEDMRELVPSDEDKAAAKTDDAKRDSGKKSSRRTHRSGSERVSIGGDSKLAEGETAEAVISIIGSSTSAGEVRDAVVSILGGSRVTGGTVGDSVVSVLGNTYVNGEVKGAVVTVLGNVELGPDAVVHGEVICFGGRLERHPDAVVLGQVQNFAVAGGHHDFSKIGAWFTECLLQGRMLAFDSRLMWAWTIALVALGIYALIALIAPAGVNKCVETLEQRPGSSLLAALLTLLLTPVAYILLALTLAIAIGVVLIPLFSLGLFFASLFGKIVMLAWLGRRITKLLGNGPLAHPVFGVLIGGMIVLALYATPYVGIIFYKLIGILGLGVVVYTLILMAKASRPPKPAPVPRATSAIVPPAVPVAPEAAAVPPPPVVPLVSAAPPVISAATLPRAGFWIRVAAALLDLVLVAIVFNLLKDILGWFVKFGGSIPLWFAVYHVVMWATKGTTIGGIICGLKVVRVDDRPLDWGVAVVRALGAFLSLALAGLGFIWVAFDDEKQSWHDKIAGTTIVKVPKGTPLL
ncbi:MAG: RDD family protein [Verrucomicrobiota bacterium]